MSLAATTVSIVLTFGTTAIIDKPSTCRATTSPGTAMA